MCNEEALPQPPNTSQKVPKNPAASFQDIKPSFVINAQACSWELAERTAPTNPHYMWSFVKNSEAVE
jgi:hypothetical protein